jgi:hypothetical protein
MMSMLTVLIPFIAMIGKWLIDRDMMSAEAKRNFLAWVKQSAKDGALGVRVRKNFEDLLQKHLEDLANERRHQDPEL